MQRMHNDHVVREDLWWDKGLLDQDLLIRIMEDHQDTPLYEVSMHV